jgi:hypothetical protein
VVQDRVLWVLQLDQGWPAQYNGTQFQLLEEAFMVEVLYLGS